MYGTKYSIYAICYANVPGHMAEPLMQHQGKQAFETLVQSEQSVKKLIMNLNLTTF